jgi:hypothetical protein
VCSLGRRHATPSDCREPSAGEGWRSVRLAELNETSEGRSKRAGEIQTSDLRFVHSGPPTTRES